MAQKRNAPPEKSHFVAQLQDWGASLVRIADIDRLKGLETDPADLLAGYSRAVSIAVCLSNDIMESIVNQPTPLYASHYGRVNQLLDDLAIRTANLLQSAGFRAVPIPASMILDADKWTSFVSHKAVALAAGIGWQGKSLLVINPDFGPRIRLVTVLTDAAIEADEPLKNRCGPCTLCKDHCPAQAIRGASTDSHYARRSDAIDLDRCVYQVRDVFSKIPHVVPLICGVCIKVCPWGAKTYR